MINSVLAEAIGKQGLRHHDESLLYSFLSNFSDEEQKAVLELSQYDKYFWIKLVVRVQIVNEELANDSVAFIQGEFKKAALEVEKLKSN